MTSGNNLPRRANLPRVSGQRRETATGFALVITISLMVLLSLLAVGLLSLSTVSLRASQSGQDLATARSNARLALTMAIGQLQEAAGPDQRITMAADLLSGGGGDASVAARARRWTGVYKAWPESEDSRPDPEFVSWLTSGDPATTARENRALSPVDSGVTMVGPGTVGDAAEGGVEVPSVGLDETGRVAWWIGDQGVKASLASPPEPDDQAPDAIRARLQSAPRNAVELASAGQGRPFAELDSEDTRTSLVTSWPQAEFLADGSGAHRPLFHDLAPYSTGLLTNVRRGGLRKDLSMFLERDPSDAPTDPLFRIGQENGINFFELWAHYNVYKELQTRGSIRYTTGGRPPRSTPYFQIAGNEREAASDPAFFYKQPAIISYQTVLSFTSRRVMSNGQPKERLALVVDPIITYWNPLDVPVSISPAYNSVKFWQLPYDLTLTAGEEQMRASLRTMLHGDAWHYLTLIAGQREPIVLKPGEVLVYSQAANTDTQQFNRGLNYVHGTAGWNLGGGVAIDVRDRNGNFFEANPDETLSYEIAPNQEDSRGTRHWSLTHYALYYKEDRASRGESIGLGGSFIDSIYGPPYDESNPKPARDRMKATSAPHVFDVFRSEDTRPLPIRQLSGRKEPIMIYAHNAKTEFSSDRGGRWMARFNPKALTHDFAVLDGEELDTLPFEVQIEPLNSWKNRQLEVSLDGNGFFGGALNEEFGTNFISTHSVPREPIHSLGALQHAFVNGFESTNPATGYATVNVAYPMLPQISHAIGNSLAPSVIRSDRTSGRLGNGQTLADHSYLANDALWDDWFFSGIAPQTTSTFSRRRPQRTVAEDFLEGEAPLPVSRYLPTDEGSDVENQLETWFDGGDPSPDAHLLTAARIRVDGLFNVNSTSVEAWKAVLGSLRGRPIITRNPDGDEQVTPADPGETPIPNLLAPADLVAQGDGAIDIKDPAQWVGRRVLTDNQIGALAEAIVREVRRRGPFLSLGDFVNRRVGRDDELARSGAIQSALDSPETGINEAYESGGRAVPRNVARRFSFPEAETGAAAYGIPGMIKQADILTPIAPVLSARSDSFIIRAYGEAATGQGGSRRVLARAWCEAVVVRDHQFLDSDDPPETASRDLRHDVNRRFGRRFRIVSFRWLNDEEI